MTLYDELVARGLIAQVTNEEEINALAEIYEKKLEAERLERIKQRTKKLENLF